MIKRLFLLMILVSASFCVLADQVVLKNGDILSGKVVGKRHGKLEIETSYAGKVKIAWSEVSELRTDSALEIDLLDGRTVTGKLKSVKPGVAQVETVAGTKTTDIAFDQISYIGSTSKTALEKKLYRGNITAAGSMEEGNSPLRDFNISVLAIINKP